MKTVIEKQAWVLGDWEQQVDVHAWIRLIAKQCSDSTQILIHAIYLHGR